MQFASYWSRNVTRAIKIFLAEFRLTVVVDLIIVIDWLIFCHFTYILIGCTFSISIISWGFDFDFLYLLIVFTHGMLIFSLLSIRLLAIWVWSFQLFFFFLFTYKSVDCLLYSFFCLHAILAMFSHANGSDPSFITIWTSPGQLKMFCINFFIESLSCFCEFLHLVCKFSCYEVFLLIVFFVILGGWLPRMLAGTIRPFLKERNFIYVFLFFASFCDIRSNLDWSESVGFWADCFLGFASKFA